MALWQGWNLTVLSITWAPLRSEAKRENRRETDQSSKHDDRAASYRIFPILASFFSIPSTRPSLLFYPATWTTSLIAAEFLGNNYYHCYWLIITNGRGGRSRRRKGRRGRRRRRRRRRRRTTNTAAKQSQNQFSDQTSILTKPSSNMQVCDPEVAGDKLSTWAWKLSPFRYYLLEKNKIQNKYKLRKSYKSRSRRYCPLEFENWAHSGVNC